MSINWIKRDDTDNNEGTTDVSIDNSTTMTEAIDALRAVSEQRDALQAQLDTSTKIVEALRVENDTQVNEIGALRIARNRFEREVSEAIVEAVDSEGLMDRSAAIWLFEHLGMDLPVSKEALTVNVVGSGSFELEVDVDEDKIADEIDNAFAWNVSDSDEWYIEDKTAQVPTIYVTVDVERATREVEVEVEIPWAATEDERYQLISEAIGEEIGDDWAVEEFEVI